MLPSASVCRTLSARHRSRVKTPANDVSLAAVREAERKKSFQPFTTFVLSHEISIVPVIPTARTEQGYGAATQHMDRCRQVRVAAQHLLSRLLRHGLALNSPDNINYLIASYRWILRKFTCGYPRSISLARGRRSSNVGLRRAACRWQAHTA